MKKELHDMDSRGVYQTMHLPKFEAFWEGFTGALF